MKKLCVFAMVAACGGGGGAAAPAKPLPQVKAPVEATPAPTFRLGDGVVPQAYRLELTVDPEKEDVQGTVEIDVEVVRPTATLWMHGKELTVASASAGATPARLLDGGAPKFIGLGFDEPLSGKMTLKLAFSAKIHTLDTDGIFKQKHDGDWYVYTDLETTDASRIFPCFDDPRWKTPVDLTVHVPAALTAIAGPPTVSETRGEGGMKTVKFATSKPLPTYLFVLAVGPFGIAEGGKTHSGAPVRIITFRGAEPRAHFAAGVTPRIAQTFEDYLGVPYPFPKLDSIAIPVTVGFSAMENPGLITYRQGALLAPPDAETYDFRQTYTEIGAHEIAHQWFGDLVTLSWWDDTWLNESFATWGESRALEILEPRWSADIERIGDRNRALAGDARAAARPVRLPVDKEEDLAEAFDYIAYEKGAAILFMIEGWVGKDTFRKGLSSYLTEHAYGNATKADFVKAMSAATGKDIGAVLSSFTDQPGAPLLSVELACAAGAPPRLHLSQTRQVTAGSSPASGLWKIPVCLRFGAGAESGEACTVMDGAQADLALEARTCPDWVIPNAGGVGYYHSILRGDKAKNLADHARGHMTPPEVVGRIGDLEGLFRGGVVPAADVLAELAALAPVENANHVYAARRLIARMAEILGPEGRPALARWVSGVFGKKARQLGFATRRTDDDTTRNLRNQILPLVAVEGGDKKLATDAETLAGKWLADRKSVDSDLVVPALDAAMAWQTTDHRAFFDRALAELRKADLDDRRRIYAALASLTDATLAREAAALGLAPDLDPREAVVIFRELKSAKHRNPGVRRAFAEHLAERYPAIAERTPRSARTNIFEAAWLLCDEQAINQFEERLRPHAAEVVGGALNLEQGLSEARECVRLAKAQRASLEAGLAGK